MYADRALAPWLDALRAALPDLALADGHVHVGLSDPAGYQAAADEVVAALERADALGVVFPLSEPDGYPPANDLVLRLAASRPDRLVPFARLDPAADAPAEAHRAVDAGARGLKLHPRGEDFELAERRLDPVFELAAERRLPVVVHDGVGTAEVGRQARRRVEEHPGLRMVLAHCAIGSFAEVVPDLHEVPDLFVDTSWWNPSDLWAALRLVPPSQVVHASDVPFNSPTQAAVMTGRLALQAGLDQDAARAVLGGNLRALLSGEAVPPLPRPDADHAPLAPELERLYVTLCSAVVPMLAGDPPGEALELAKAGTRTPSDRHGAVLDAVAELLELAERCTERDPLRPLRTPGFDVVLTAALVARTPDVPLPG